MFGVAYFLLMHICALALHENQLRIKLNNFKVVAAILMIICVNGTSFFYSTSCGDMI